MYLIIIAAIVVGLAFWVAAARLLRKLYWVSRIEARWLRLKDEGSNDNEPLPVIRLNSPKSWHRKSLRLACPARSLNLAARPSILFRGPQRGRPDGG
jgi:hypothetical protein